MNLSVNEITTIYRSNVDRIYKYFFFRILNKEIAQDLTSETFTSFIHQVNNVEIENIDSYISGIATNIFNKYLKEKYSSKEINTSNADLDAWNAKENDNNHFKYSNLLKKILPYLPLKQRTVMELRFINNLSIKEIAKKLKKDENYVSTTQKRAFKTVKKILSVQKI